MWSQWIWAAVIDDEYDIRFVEIRITNIEDYMVPSMFLATNHRANLTCYITAGKMVIRHQGMRVALVKL